MSYTEISADKVLNACDAYLTKRNLRIEKDREGLIENIMSRPFFPVKTRERAIEVLQSGDIMSKWNLAEIRGSGPASQVEDLKALAEVALKNSAKIRLATEDATILKDYF